MKPTKFLAVSLLAAGVFNTHAATLAHRYSFSGDTNDSAGGNTGILINGATVTATELSLSGGPGTGANVQNMGFTNVVGIGTNFSSTGVTIESWYTDAGTSTWGKLFTFGSAVAGQEFGYTHRRANGQTSGIDRNGAQLLGFDVSQGVEHHLVISVASGGNMNAWLDGSQIFTNLATNPISNITSATESIGATAWGDPGHFGTVNEFRIWSGELTDAEVIQSLALGPDNLIPEPAGAALAGLGAMVLLRRRRRA